MAETVLQAHGQALHAAKEAVQMTEDIKNLLWERMNFAIQVLDGKTAFPVEKLGKHLREILQEARDREATFMKKIKSPPEDFLA